jgi:hypothetical protein
MLITAVPDKGQLIFLFEKNSTLKRIRMSVQLLAGDIAREVSGKYVS